MKTLVRALAAALVGLFVHAQADDPTPATVAGYWPALLARYCAKRTNCATVEDPVTAASMLLSDLDMSVLASVAAAQQKSKLIALKKDTLDGLLGRLAPANDSSAGTQGSPIQSDAVPSTTPVAQSGVNVGLAGTQTGTRLVTTVAVNPAGLVTTSSSTIDDQAQKAGTLASRVADLSVVLPVDTSANHATSSDALGSFDYVGVRLRVNAAPLLKDDLYDTARKATEDLFAKALRAEGSTSDAIADLLSSFDDTGCALSIAQSAAQPPQCNSPQPADFTAKVTAAGRCVEALDLANPDQIVAQCGKQVPQLETVKTTELALRDALQLRRDQHDADFVGLDARYDYGDPTFSNDPAARGTYLLAGVAGGHRILAAVAHSRRFFGVRARLGWNYSSMTQTHATNNSTDYAGGIELGTITDLRVLKVSLGVEGRRAHGSVSNTVDTNYADGKIAVDFPLSDGSMLGLVLTIPLSGKHVTTLGISGNWTALLGALQQTGGSHEL